MPMKDLETVESPLDPATEYLAGSIAHAYLPGAAPFRDDDEDDDDDDSSSSSGPGGTAGGPRC